MSGSTHGLKFKFGKKNILSAKHVFAFTLSCVQTIKQEWNEKHRNVSLFLQRILSGSSKPAYAQTHQR